jgi:hypothetical protein
VGPMRLKFQFQLHAMILAERADICCHGALH